MALILEMINEGVIAADIAKSLDIKKPHISYYIRKGKDNGFIKETFRDVFKVLELTSSGKKFLDQCQNNSLRLPICRAENIQFRATIIQMPTIPVDWKKIQMHNWVQYQSELDSLKLKLNLGEVPSLEFLPSPLDGDDPFDLFVIMVYECVNAQMDLYNKFGLRTGKVQLGSRGEWLVYDPIARAFCKTNGQVNYEGIGKVNSSKPRSIGEFEFHDPRALYDYLLMPARLKNIERLLEQILRKDADCLSIERDGRYCKH